MHNTLLLKTLLNFASKNVINCRKITQSRYIFLIISQHYTNTGLVYFYNFIHVLLWFLVWEPLFWSLYYLLQTIFFAASQAPNSISFICRQLNNNLFISLCVYPMDQPYVCVCVSGSSLSCTDPPGSHAGRLKWTSSWAGWGNRWTGMMGSSHRMCVQLRKEHRPEYMRKTLPVC